ncbi:MAG TPA: glycoside hydrolase family 130 protein [Propionibacteriaceae bacterium]
MTESTTPPLIRRTAHILRPDPTRVVSKLFLPGQEFLAAERSRSAAVLDRVLALHEAEVSRALAATMASFGSRHRDLAATLESRFRLVAHRLADPDALSPERRQLVGAYFSQEYAVEAAALFNPSMVAHPDQDGLPPGTMRFVMSVRGVGEGHISSIEFRTGTIDENDAITFDALSSTTVLAQAVPTTYSRAVFAQQHAELGGDQSSARFVLEALPASFVRADLDRTLARLRAQRLTRASAAKTIDQFERIAACNYSITFPADSAMNERVILPTGPSESHGLEDVRLVKFTGSDGGVGYLGTYTAFDGGRVVPQLLRTDDFRTFQITQLSGSAAKNKGMALFPRPVDGQHLALSRWDREDNSLATSDDWSNWVDVGTLERPHEPWEIVQLGNCGSPLETPAGWLVLTHGVGPMREYSIGAMLLDLDDPRKVRGRLHQPLLTPAADERNGYVPNVVYSCGGLVHNDTLVLPYGESDVAIRIALINLTELLQELQGTGTRREALTSLPGHDDVPLARRRRPRRVPGRPVGPRGTR